MVPNLSEEESYYRRKEDVERQMSDMSETAK